ncbi:MAG: aminotransferase class V-fold PLP-dependent enzyme [Bacteroidota bacterium]
MHKRTFLKTAATLTLGAPALLNALDYHLGKVPSTEPEALAANEDFWASVRADYRLPTDYINLENGYYCLLPEPTLEAYLDHLRQLNYENSRYLRTVQFENKNRMRTKLAELAGVAPENVIITRNTTESLNTVISGYPWQEGDEAVMAAQDYGAMLDMFGQVAKRYGTVNRRVSVPLHPVSDAEIVETYARAITPRTKLLMVCHLINITGQVLPVRKICDMAHARGVEVMVDGAHSFAQLDFNLPELDCDYFGTSLHKWLSVPLGTGMLYIRPEKTEKIWPLFPEHEPPKNDLLRLNHTGTHPCATDLAIADAIDYYRHLGAARKEARLRYLRRYWTERVRELEHVSINTPAAPERACAIANVGVTTLTPHELAERLFTDYRIWTVAIDGAGVHGVRITPNVYTSTEELDVLVRALGEMG